MIFKPRQLGRDSIEKDELENDKKKCRRFGPCGVGEKAIYLNSFYFDRMYYIPLTSVKRAFKRVAMSKGGFTGKGIFATTPYLVVQRSDGTEQQCNFKIEAEVDEVLEEIHQKHPEIPVYSAESEKKLRKARAEQEARYLKKLPEDAAAAVRNLEKAKTYLQQDERYSKMIVFAAKQKRSLDGTKTSLKTLAALIDAGSVALIAAGLYLRMVKGNSMGIYLALFGGAFILSVAASQILPTPHRNRKTAQADWEEALRQMKGYIGKTDTFPVPPQYAHPVVLDRMIRVVREGRAADEEGALETVKKDLKALNASVTVSQQEYDEVVTIKPLFIVSGYQ